jgi:hypothetical protein
MEMQINKIIYKNNYLIVIVTVIEVVIARNNNNLINSIEIYKEIIII